MKIKQFIELLTKNKQSDQSELQDQLTVVKEAASKTKGFGGANKETTRLKSWGDRCDPNLG